jgi:DNA invertase Pin-like site-specific DNA recombinase
LFTTNFTQTDKLVVKSSFILSFQTASKREELLKLAKQRKVDVIIVWRLDRWGRSLADLIVSLRELTDLGVGFVSLTETLDLTEACA